jgi:flagellar biosynthesis/type III secretory pathway protein FliH
MSNAFAPPSANKSREKGGFTDVFQANKAGAADSAPVVSPEKIKQIYEQAYTDGYERGMIEGHQNALEAGRKIVANEQRMLVQLLVSFQKVYKN